MTGKVCRIGYFWLVSTIAAVMLSGVVEVAADTAPVSGKPVVFAGIPPHAHIVESIAKDLVEVEVLIKPGQSPVTYDPTPRQMARLAEAKMLFTIGLPFEQRLLEKLSTGFDSLETVDTREGIELLSMGDDDHGQAHAGSYDPHIWLDPNLVKIQATNMAEALARRSSRDRQRIMDGLSAYHQVLDQTDSIIRKELAGLEGRRIYVFHPTYGYFCNAYGLEQVAIERSGKNPSARQLAELVKQCRADSAHTIFVQPQFSGKAAQAIAEAIDGEVVTLDPLAENITSNLLDISNKIAKALRQPAIADIGKQTNE